MAVGYVDCGVSSAVFDFVFFGWCGRTDIRAKSSRYADGYESTLLSAILQKCPTFVGFFDCAEIETAQRLCYHSIKDTIVGFRIAVCVIFADKLCSSS